MGLQRSAISLAFVLGALVLSSCGGGGGGKTTTVISTATTTTTGTSTTASTDPAAVESRYMSNCERTAQAASGTSRDFSAACRCALDYIEAHESMREFIADSARFARTVRYPPIWRQAILACRDRIPGA